MWYTKLILFLLIIHQINCNDNDNKVIEKLSNKCIKESNFESCLQKRALQDLIKNQNDQHYEFSPGVSVDSVENRQEKQLTGDEEPSVYILSKVEDYLKNHVVNINLGTALQGWQSQIGYSQERYLNSRTGSNTFLTGFGLGFLAFALKKLLLPVFIGAQVVKSILLAMFLPTLLSGIGKFLGKSGATVFGASSGPSDDFDFKDNYDPSSSYDTAASTNTATFTYPSQSPQNRYESSLDTSYTNPANYYQSEKIGMSQYTLQNMYKNRRPIASTLKPSSTLDFKQFHNIPSSSLMLSNYDPFYSPLLSRLDSIFKQMGYEQGDEACREKVVCYMYRTPAKYVPYSNLVSAQLSRELNELQKPSANNPGVLRFFRYMKAAKDGQDHNDCDHLYSSCRAPELQSSGGKSSDPGILGANPPMVKTYNEINKLVQARRLSKQLEA